MYRILYADDEETLLYVCKVFLEKDGLFSVETVTSATDALQRMQSASFDAIISDYQMPVMDGIAFLKAVRGAMNTIPFIIFTGRGREEIVIQALNEGADYYLQKGGEPTSQFAELAHKLRLAILQRRAEASIRDHERREEDIINFLPDATFAIDTEGVVIAWNRAMEDLTGVPAAEMMGKGDHAYAIPLYHERRPILIDLVLSDDPATEARYPYVLRSGKKLFSEVNLPERNNGEGMLIWFTASPIYDTEGRIVGAIESIRDITGRRKAEEKLKESERRYRDVVETQTEFVSRFRPDGTHVFANEAYCRHFGMDREEIIGHRFVPKIPEEDREAVRAHFSSLTRDNPGASIEHRVIMPDGSLKWHYWNDHAIFNEEGRLVEYQSLGKDITERKQAEEEIRASEQKLAAAFDASPFPMAITDLETGRIADINRAFEEWSGFSRTEIHGSTPVNLNMWAFPEERRAIVDLLKEGRTVQDRAVTLQNRRGEQRDVLFSCRAFRSGEHTYMFSLAEDVTEERRTEVALRDREEQFAAIFNTAQMGIVVIDAVSHAILQVNRRAQEMIGAPEEAIAGRVCHTFICPSDQGLCPVTDLGQEVNASECVLLTKDGHSVPIMKTVVSAVAGNRKVLFESFFDISERMQATERIREAEQRLTGIINFLPDATFAIDNGGTVIAWNRAIEEMTGVPASEMIGKGNYEYSIPFYGVRRPILIDLISRDDEEIRKNYSFVRRDGDVLTAETTMSRPGGRDRVLWGKAGPLYTSHGTMAGAIESIRDITGFRLLEESAKKQAEKTGAGTGRCR